MKLVIRHKAAYRTAALAGLSFFLFARITDIKHVWRVDSGPYGHYTLQQILVRSSPLCGALASVGKTENEPLQLTGSRLSTWARGAEYHLWIVDAVDTHDRFKVHLVWDADTGELISASRPADEQATRRDTPLLKCGDARRITASWLTTLGMSELDSGWRLDSAPLDMTNVWRVEWRAGTREIAVTIDARNGDLLMAQCMKPISLVGHNRMAMETLSSCPSG